MLYTTLELLRKQNACSGGMSILIASLPKNHSDDKLISISHILKSNGLEHGIWALRATTVDARKIAARMAIDFAYTSLVNFEKVFPEDKRPRTALQVASDFLDGKAILADVESAWSAASAAAASAAAWSAAAWSAESAAASAAASAARSAASAGQKENEKIFLKHLRKAK